MGNAKTYRVASKHRKRQAAAKESVRLYLMGKLEEEKLSTLARRYLVRHLRVARKA